MVSIGVARVLNSFVRVWLLGFALGLTLCLALGLARGVAVVVLVDEFSGVPVWGFRSWVLLVAPVWAGGLAVILVGEVIIGLWSCAGSI